MSDPRLGLVMLGLIVAAIMMGFPTAFTLMGLGMIFGYIAFWVPGQHWYDNRAFDLIVQRAYGVMTNDALLSIPLFVFMGYIMERAALVDKVFQSVQLAFGRVPASLAVTTMLVSAFWGIASGIVGAVVVLMGVIAMGPMLKAGYDVRLASGTITAGGTLGILIPPSVMLIVYAAVAGQSIVKLYAAAMLPGFFLTGLYLVYILGWAIINPKIAPKLRPDQYRVTVPDYLRRLEGGRTGSVVPGLVAAAFRPALARGARGDKVVANKLPAVSVVPLGVLTVVVLVVILFGICTATESAAIGALGALYLAVMARYPKAVWWWSLLGVVVGVALGWYEGEDVASLVVAASIGGTFTGTVIPGIWYLRKSPELRENLKQATFLTAKTTAMVCWLFVGSALFSAVFALHGGQSLIERWVLSMNLSPLGDWPPC